VLQWVEWSEAKLLPNVLGYVLPSVSAVENMVCRELCQILYSFDVFQPVDQAKSDLLAQLHHLNDYLLTRTYLVDERISLADISVALDLVAAYQHVFNLEEKFVLTLPGARWYGSCKVDKSESVVSNHYQSATCEECSRRSDIMSTSVSV
jgi:elongation factor 1-gamma